MKIITRGLSFSLSQVTAGLIHLKNLHLQNSLDKEWYVSYITRPEAEAALRKINQV
jgi:hypothetical protein